MPISLHPFEHHLSELIEADLTVSVNVNFLRNLHQIVLSKSSVKVDGLLDLVNRDRATTVLVEHFEGLLQLLVAQQLLLTHGGHHELRVVDLTRVVRVHLSEYSVDVPLTELLIEVVVVALSKLLLVEHSISIHVESPENLVDVCLLRRSEALGCQKGEGSLLENGLSLEVLQVAECLHGRVVGYVLLASFLGLSHPGVVQSLNCTRSFLGVRIQNELEELFCCRGHILPQRVHEADFAYFDSSEDLVLCLSVERRQSRDENVSNNTD